MTQSAGLFGVQRSVRGPWRRYVDQIAEHRPALHAYCRRLTGNVWDGEDLVQDTLIRVFSLLGKTDTRLENPKAYLIVRQLINNFRLSAINPFPNWKE